jgi:serine/threonine-protein kinase RsbW
MKQHEADHIQMSVPAKPEYVGVVRLTVSGIANRVGFSYDDIEDMKIAVAEACTNVVNHAYEEGGVMNVSYFLYKNRLEIVVADRGQSFEIGSVRERLGPIDAGRPVEDLKEGGLGLFLINTLMDKVEIYDESGIILIMTKFLHGDEVEQDVERIIETQPEQ